MAYNFVEEEIENIVEGWIVDGIEDDANMDMSSEEDSDTSIDSDEEVIPRTCIKNYVENVVRMYSEVVFKRHFRLTRHTTYSLIERFQASPFLCEATLRIEQIDHERAFLLTLWYLANTETFRQVADRFDVTRSSAHRILIKTIDFICSLKDDFIKWPFEEDEKKNISQGFAKQANIQGVIGAVDGCHIRIRRPVEHAIDYMNRKGYYSIVLQGIATSKKLFTDVYIGEAGSQHDARIFRKSPIFHRATNDPEFLLHYHLLGDSAYPNLSWLVPPFRDNGHLTEQQRRFNFRHSSTRIKIEHSFGQLKSKFRRLECFKNIRLDIIIKCVMAACILHNVIILQDEEDNDADDGVEENGLNYVCDNGIQDKRDYLFHLMFP